MDVCKYQRFNENHLAKDSNEFKNRDLDSVLLLINANTYVKYRQYKQVNNFYKIELNYRYLFHWDSIFLFQAADDETCNTIIEYGKLVGKTLAHRMLYLKF